jgi:hypothetical protein
MLGETVTGLIDFYFACTDIIAYDVAVTHAAWCFDNGRVQSGDFGGACWPATNRSALSVPKRAALPVLARGAAMRFLSTRAYDWINTPPDALVVARTRWPTPAAWPSMPPMRACSRETGRNLHRRRLQGQPRPRRLGALLRMGPNERNCRGGGKPPTTAWK